LSSTTESTPARGQVLVLFAGSLVAIFLIAALAFDVGMTLLERRDQQNAADAAALAGARYVRTAANFNGSCAAPGTNAAVIAACNMALANDYDNAATDENVFVRIPPVSGEFRALPGHIQVDIDASRGSIFAGVIGIGRWSIGASAVAANQPGVHYSFGMIALDPNDCDAIKITGSGTVNSAGSVQSNSDGSLCAPDNWSLTRSGSGTLNVTAPDAVCRAVGAIHNPPSSGTMSCSTLAPFSFALPDPLAGLPAPVKPALAARMKEVNPTSGAIIDPAPNIPNFCPGATGGNAPVEATPQMCTLGQGGSQQDRKWILSPGLYPGGLTIKGGVTAYLLPGIYWIGGGGITGQDGSVISVNSETDRTPATCTLGATPPCINGGGVLIYNTKLSTSGAGAPGPIKLDGNGIMLNLQPYDFPWGATTIKLVIFQDRTISSDVTLNGASSAAGMVRGIVYAPLALVKVNGSNSTFSMDQVIANTFQINGSGGTVNVLHETGVDAIISAVGLVQ
jgi:hypothetical protein